MKTSVSRTASLKGDLEWSTLPCVWHWWTMLLMWALESLRGIMTRMAHEETRGRCGLRRNSRKPRSYKGGADRSRDWEILYTSKYREVALYTDGRLFDLNWQEELATHAKRFEPFSRGVSVVCDGFQIHVWWNQEDGLHDGRHDAVIDRVRPLLTADGTLRGVIKLWRRGPGSCGVEP